ncbi:MAG TPA: NUMOD3 domain-containing DNA-binding protein [Nitrosopumilaceae archaeon]|jgi:hypothetical protein|nr:NUMOD3 domain-containing DNA-binding protein [Nitrosopumilaceae archaeon]
MKYKIYTLSDPITVEIRYIGYTEQKLSKRLKNHRGESRSKLKHKIKQNHRNNWINSLLKQNLEPIIELLEETDNYIFSEKFWISQFKCWGFNLVNGTEGGEETNTSINSKENLEQRRKKWSGKNNPQYGIDKFGKNNPFYNKNHSKETILFLKNRQFSLETKKKMSNSAKKRDRTSYFKKIIQLDFNNVIVNKFKSITEASFELKTSQSNIIGALKGKQKTAKGFYWKYID